MRNIKDNLRKITSLILAASMIMSTNIAVLADSESSQVQEIVVASEAESEASADKAAKLEIVEKEDSTQEIITNAAPEEGEEDEELLGEDSGTTEYVELENWLFGYFLDAICEFSVKFDTNYSGKEMFKHVSRESLEKVKELAIDTDFQDDKPIGTPYNNIRNYNDLEKLTNLKSLTLKGLKGNNNENIDNIKFPSSLTSLTIKDCGYACKPDISGCTKLEKLEFTNNSFVGNKDTISKIDGLTNSNHSGLKSLKSAKFDGSAINELYFDDAASADLELSVENCKKLVNFSSGGYRIKDNVSFTGCAELVSLQMKGYCDGNNTFSIKSCNKLNEVSLTYFFSSDTSTLSVDSSLVDKTTGTFTVARSAGSAAGKFDVKAVKGSFIDTSVENLKKDSAYEGFFNETTAVDMLSEIKYIIFDKDLYHKSNDSFMTGVLWDYSFNKYPVVLRIGEVMANNRPHFYTEDKLEVDLDTSKYSVTVNKISVPTGKAINDQTYSVISIDDSREMHVTGVSPGRASITVSVKKSDTETLSRTQNIIVCPLIETMTIGTNEPVTVVGSGKHKFSTTMTLLEAHAGCGEDIFCGGNLEYDKECNNTWKLYKEGTNGYEQISDINNNTNNPTPDGLSVVFKTSNKKVEGNKVTYNDSYIEVKESNPGGFYKLKGKVYNKNINDNTTNVDSDEYYFNIINVVQSCNEIGYGYNNDPDSANRPNSEATFEVNGASSDYSATARIREDDIRLNDDENSYIRVIPVDSTDPKTNRRFKLEFNTEKYNNKEIAKYLLDLYNKADTDENDDNKVTIISDGDGSRLGFRVRVDFTFSKEGEPDAVLTKELRFSGYFTVDYDLDGGTNAESNFTSYTFPMKNQDAMNLQEPTKTGYDFAGWFVGDKEITTFLDEDGIGDVSLKAHWEKREPITYELNGGTNNPENPVERSIVTDDLTLKDPRKTGYDFKGWYDLENSAKEAIKVIRKGTPTYTKFTATWSPTKYKISYVLGVGGVNNVGNPSEYNIESDTITLKEPTREDHIFVGWVYTDNPSQVVTEIKQGSYGDISLTAKWQVVETHIHEEVLDPYVAPSCETVGKSAGIHCATCDEILIPQKEIKALGHKMGTGVVTKAATADEEGQITSRCLRSGCTHTVVETIPSFKVAEDVVGEDYKIISNPDKPITDTTINVIGVSDATYTGKAITFDIRVYVGKTLLKEGTDYTLKYLNNKTVAAADASDKLKPQVIITGKGAYSDANTYKFEPVYFAINPIDIAELEKTGDALVADTAVIATATQKLVKPVPDITINGKKLTKKDYEVSYGEGHENGIDTSLPGKYKITLTGKGNYAGTVTATYQVVENSAENPAVLISKATVSGIKKSLNYNGGEALTQSGYVVKCKIGKDNVELAEGTDYIVRYLDNSEVGVASMIISAKAKNDKGLVGQKVVTFKIAGLAINKCQITYEKKVDYTGATIKPGLDDKYKLTISDIKNNKSEPLVYGQDYEVEYFRNVQAGTATMLITGKDFYTGSVKKTFKINAINLVAGKEQGTIEASIVPGSVNLETSGKLAGKYTAKPYVTFNGKELKEGKDYVVNYKNNKTPALSTDAKAPTVILKGKGNYAKSIPLTFDIVE